MNCRILYFITAVILVIGLIAGCSDSKNGGPTLPSPGGPAGGGYDGDQPEPPIPTPFAAAAGTYIIDMEWEADGDLVIATNQGMLLFTPYGLLKRNLGVPNVLAIANNNSGRGMSYQLAGGRCAVDGVDDDIYVSNGHNTVTFGEEWFAGNADMIPEFCEPNITMGWSCPQGITQLPTGYEYHPYTARTYILLHSGGVYIGDGECLDFGIWHPDIGPVVSPLEWCGVEMDNVILSYDAMAPFLDGFWTGPGFSDLPNGDYNIYVQKPVWDCFVFFLAGIAPGYEWMLATTKVLSWTGINPDLNPMASC